MALVALVALVENLRESEEAGGWEQERGREREEGKPGFSGSSALSLGVLLCRQDIVEQSIDQCHPWPQPLLLPVP